MSNIETIHLIGRVRWAKVHKPVLGFDKVTEQFEIEVEVSDEKLQELKALGMHPAKKARTDENGVKFLKFVKKTKSKSGELLKPPTVVDANAQPLTDSIGNGSVADVAITVIPYDNQFGKGVSLSLAGVQVLEPVEFVSNQLFSAVEGDKNTSSTNDDQF